MKRFIKYSLLSALALFLLLMLALSFTQTSVFKNFLNKKITGLVNSNTNLNLSVEKIEGNLFNTIHLINVTSEHNDTTIASIPSIRVKFELLSLLKRQIYIDSLIVKAPVLNLYQYRDSSWNFQYLFSKVRNDFHRREKKEFNYIINVRHFSMQNGITTQNSFSDLLPNEFSDLNLILDGKYQKDHTELRLRNMNFKSGPPLPEVYTLNIKFKKDTTGIYLEDFLFQSRRSDININGFYSFKDSLSVNIIANKIAQEEVEIFFPKLKLTCSPEIRSYILSDKISTCIRLELINGNQNLSVETIISPISNILNDPNGPVPFTSTFNLRKFIPEKWIELPLTKIIASGNITLVSDNLLDLNSRIKLKADLKELIYSGEKFDALSIDGSFQNNEINGSIELRNQSMSAEIKTAVNNIFTFPSYSISSKIDHLNLTSYFPEMEGTVLSGEIRAEGNHFELPELNAHGFFLLDQSTVYNIPVNSAMLYWDFKNMTLQMDSFRVQVDGGSISGDGTYDFTVKEFNSEIYAELDSLSFIRDSLEIPFSFHSLAANASVSGRKEYIYFSGDSEIYGFNDTSFQVNHLKQSFNGFINPDTVFSELEMNGYGITVSKLVSDHLRINANYINDKIDAQIFISFRDSINSRLKTQIALGDTVSIVVDSLNINTFSSKYYLLSDFKPISLNGKYIHFPEIVIKDHLNPEFKLKVGGNLSKTEQNDFYLVTESFNTERFNSLFLVRDSIKGIMNLHIKVHGPFKSFNALASLDIIKPQLGDITVPAITGRFNYSEEQLRSEISVPDVGNGIWISSELPLSYHSDSTGIVLSTPQKFDAEIQIDSLSLSDVYQANKFPDMGIGGVLNSNIKASGSFKKPLFYGSVYLNNLEINDYGTGIFYDNINASIKLDGKKINVDSLNILQKSGYLRAKGELEFDSTLISGKIINSSIAANARNFHISKKPDFEVKIDAGTFLRMGKLHPEFGGEIKILQSDFNMDELTENKRLKNDEQDIPLLIQAISGEEYPDVELREDSVSEEKKSNKQAKFLENIQGRLKVIIPHNTWLRSENMNLELNGDFDIVKTGSDFEIFGNVDVSRGSYIIYGKKLSINEGEIIFAGGDKIDPEFKLIADLKFKDSDGNTHKLEVGVSGYLSNPDISFTLDDKGISETEAMYILLFGKTGEELAASGQAGMVSSLGAGKLSQIITSQLNKTLGNTFNLDYIEVASTDNWQSASFVIGRYISNDLFVTYQRGFGESEGDEITPSEVTLEYKLNRLLFMRLQSGTSKSSGLDAILKFEQKKMNQDPKKEL